uniref:Longistatin n=1 Tax=Rhipicephalus zambeziensis TaxID=60191 RepID=A0A224YID1_9ACAR
MQTLAIWGLCATVLFVVVAADLPPPDSKAGGEAAELRKKWSAVQVARDLGHIRKDVAKMIELGNAGVMSQDELSFYYFRMHDFDNNNLLDGQEMMAAMFHTSHHDEGEHAEGQLEVIPEADIASYVDSALLADKNHDGYISYPELRASDLASPHT